MVFSKGKVVTANEVLSAGPQSQPLLETAIITLMHLALESEKIELEVLFEAMISACVTSFFLSCFVWGWGEGNLSQL